MYLIVMVIALIVIKALHDANMGGDKWKMGRSVSFKDFEVAPNREYIRG